MHCSTNTGSSGGFITKQGCSDTSFSVLSRTAFTLSHFLCSVAKQSVENLQEVPALHCSTCKGQYLWILAYAAIQLHSHQSTVGGCVPQLIWCELLSDEIYQAVSGHARQFTLAGFQPIPQDMTNNQPVKGSIRVLVFFTNSCQPWVPTQEYILP